jgi:KDO2-lipid IV(A) lauroyltransferase
MVLMKKFIINSLFWSLSRLPLAGVRCLGSMIGTISLCLSNKSAQRLPYNLLLSGLATPDTVKQLTKATAKALGMTLAEAALIAWAKDKERISRLIQVDESFYAVKELLCSGSNVVFLTPHLGNFEIAVKYFAYHLPIDLQILYKPAKNLILEEIMFKGRQETNILPVPTTRRGVLSLIKHLRNGGCIGLLPDNVASAGDGEWVKFFGQDVYATSLAAKISLLPQVRVIIVQSIRTKTGFLLKCIPFIPESPGIPQVMQQLYSKLEEMVRLAPEQYYWSYDRFRKPNHAKAMPQSSIIKA